MPLFRRIPKRGFTDRNSKVITGINLSVLENKFNDGEEVTIEALLSKGVIKKVNDGVKVLGNGELTKKLNVKLTAFSASAKEKIEALGGTCEVI
jgi:large subunit ribosomal protein L15